MRGDAHCTMEASLRSATHALIHATLDCLGLGFLLAFLSHAKPFWHGLPSGLALRLRFTLVVLGLNVGTFLCTATLPSGQIDPGVLGTAGFSYRSLADHHWLVLASSGFLHFHWLHLGINMAMLLLLCGSLEVLKGARFAATIYLVALGANLPSGLFLWGALRLLSPRLWSETYRYVDVGASLGIMGCLGGLARILAPAPRWALLGIAVVGSLVGSLYIRNPFGIDHAFSAALGYLTASWLLAKPSKSAEIHPLRSEEPALRQTRAL